MPVEGHTARWRVDRATGQVRRLGQSSHPGPHLVTVEGGDEVPPELTVLMARQEQPALMAKAFADAINAGRAAFQAGLMQKRQTASPSTPVIGQPFWHQQNKQQ